MGMLAGTVIPSSKYIVLDIEAQRQNVRYVGKKYESLSIKGRLSNQQKR